MHAWRAHHRPHRCSSRETLAAAVVHLVTLPTEFAAVDDRQRFAMFAQWLPPVKPLADQMVIAGIPGDLLTDEVLAGFKGFHVARPSTIDSAAGWCFRLVTWIKRERVKTAGASPQAGTTGFDDDDTTWINGVEA